jgi:hypothetical protein
MIQKPLSEVSAADLQELVSAAVHEGRTIDYKATLPGATDDAKRSLLYDVTAFANTLGGDIVFGIEEKPGTPGVPGAVVGVDIVSREQEEQRLEAIMRSRVDPRIPGVALRWVEHPTQHRPTLISSDVSGRAHDLLPIKVESCGLP